MTETALAAIIGALIGGLCGIVGALLGADRADRANRQLEEERYQRQRRDAKAKECRDELNRLFEWVEQLYGIVNDVLFISGPYTLPNPQLVKQWPDVLDRLEDLHVGPPAIYLLPKLTESIAAISEQIRHIGQLNDSYAVMTKGGLEPSLPAQDGNEEDLKRLEAELKQRLTDLQSMVRAFKQQLNQEYDATY